MREINRTVVVTVATVALAAVAAVWIWSSQNRYYLIQAPERNYSRVYEIDKRTGRVWVVSSSGKRLVPVAPHR